MVLVSGPAPLRVSPVAFSLLLAVESLFVLGSLARRPRLAAASRIAVFVAPLALALSLRAWVAFTIPGVVEWDETYYLSAAVTAADGRGLYPYVFGYAPMPVMGGLGYAAYLNALAVLAAGPTIFALRAVSLAASIAGLVCLWLLVRALYGSGAAWIAAALVSALRLFIMSNSARMDSFAFAWVAGALLLVTTALRYPESRRLHFLAGLAFGLGLQVHIDTAVTAGACGILYLVTWLRQARAQRRVMLPTDMLLYVAGWTAGLVAFVAFNILPDPDAFYRTTVLIRVDATSWYSGGTSSIFGSFLDPRILLAKEVERYTLLFRSLHGIEIALVATAIVAMAARRGPVDVQALIVIGSVIVLAAILLNNASPLYFIHITPALVVPLAALFSHGLALKGKVRVSGLGTGQLLAFAVVISALCAVNTVKTVWPRAAVDQRAAADAEFARRARAAIDSRCRIAGDGRLYVPHFADYPYFVSARPTEVDYAMIFHGVENEAEYWEIKAPEAVLMMSPLSAGLSAYLASHGLAPVGDGIWLAPGGCEGRPQPTSRRSSRTGTSPVP